MNFHAQGYLWFSLILKLDISSFGIKCREVRFRGSLSECLCLQPQPCMFPPHLSSHRIPYTEVNRTYKASVSPSRQAERRVVFLLVICSPKPHPPLYKLFFRHVESLGIFHMIGRTVHLLTHVGQTLPQVDRAPSFYIQQNIPRHDAGCERAEISTSLGRSSASQSNAIPESQGC